MAGSRDVKAAIAKSAPAMTSDELTERQLAKAVLARTIRPKIADVRRLAEGVLAKADSKKKQKLKKTAGKKAKATKPDRKLAKIPGQKRKNADA